MKRMVAGLLALCLTFAGTAALAAETEKTDPVLYVDSTVPYSFSTQSGREINAEETGDKVRVLSFMNLSTDTSYFLADDLSNSRWASGDAVDIVAVDVTGASAETLALYSQGLDHTAIALVTDADKLKTAEAFAQEAGIDARKLTFPFTVILDEDGTLCYAMEGYRKPDLLAEYINEVTGDLLKVCAPAKEIPSLFAYSWKDGVRLYWLESGQGFGYALWRGEAADGPYEIVYTAEDSSGASFTDSSAKANTTYYYKLEIQAAGGSDWSSPTRIVREEVK